MQDSFILYMPHLQANIIFLEDILWKALNNLKISVKTGCVAGLCTVVSAQDSIIHTLIRILG
jgi:hypothetical protein